ncbi:MAG: hypothetical protein ABII75_01360 [Candidatus Omnitrophota bacterium]
MAREKITRRQKNVSRLLREKKEIQGAILNLNKKTKKYGQK